ncbi:Lpg1974 family pore-forming outer membrane protein [Legionella shakespearei]|uniref:Outer membrane protein n=1 Tax=Legionella shakespearei DSM 23087 TaxID=1122169 RepID=A0A0W0Z4X6_9GAMM|nr:Lpg1974 family pore-forming outer membrane protein [Legionella shakespearei]KTD64208.1 outer membrane protein [Legionella shakespearei DSM 23087]
MLKKTTLAVLGLAVNGFASAGTMGPVCTPGNVTVPCETKQWDLGVQALYMKVIQSADRAYLHTVAPFDGYGEFKNDWDWGYKLEGSYHFNTGNDITLTWMHYKSDTTQGDFRGFIPFSTLAPPLFTSYTAASENQLDQVNLVMGQHADFGLVKNMRFYGGLQYANIRSDITHLYNQSPAALIPSGITSVSLHDDSDFKGVGPVIGIDYSYDLTNEFSLTANGAGSILYGSSRVFTGYVGAPVAAVIASWYGSKKTMVPSLEAKLGVNYAYGMAQGTLNIEGGYQVVNYFHALQTFGVESPAANVITTSDFGLYGPYLGLKYVGNV